MEFNRRSFLAAVGLTPALMAASPRFVGRDGATFTPETSTVYNGIPCGKGPMLQAEHIAIELTALLEKALPLRRGRLLPRIPVEYHQCGVDFRIQHNEMAGLPMNAFRTFYLIPVAERISEMICQKAPNPNSVLHMGRGEVPALGPGQAWENARNGISARYIRIYDLMRDEWVTRFDAYYTFS